MFSILSKSCHLFLYDTIPNLKQTALENIVGKGENAGNQHFLFSRNVFYRKEDGNQHLGNIIFFACKSFKFVI